MQSLWERETEMPLFPGLEGEKRTDVLIIGGGMAGILCAYFLRKYGVEYCLVEGGRIAERTTGHTTAKITSQHGLVYHEIADRYGAEAAALYYSANQRALENYRVLCEKVDCDWEEKENYVYSVKNRKKLEREMQTLESIHAKASFEEILPLPFGTCGAVSFPGQAQFHPFKFIKEIVKGLNIYENTKVLGFGEYVGAEKRRRVVLSGGGKILAKKIIVATHFPMLNKHGSYFMKLYQHRSYVLALKNAPYLPGMYVDEDKKGLSFRTAGDCLLLGGGGHRTGKDGGSFTELRGVGEEFFPQAQEVFDPSRPMITGQLAVNLAESALGLCSLSKRRCPHLGCALKWNKEEHSWDCPCHGSRFSEDGEVLENPANGNLR